MFDNILQEIQHLDGSKVSVTLPSDEDGYLDRTCPSEHCQFLFKILEEDWRQKVRDEKVFCPFCRTSSSADNWNTPQQIKYAKAIVSKQISGRLGQAMRLDANAWNHRQFGKSLISITMKVNSRPQTVFLPPAVAKIMQLKIVCPECGCRYAVIGAAFFCPACGHNSADQMFSQALTGIRNALEATPIVRSSIPDNDTAETTVRMMIENALEDLVTAFQRYAESLYETIPNRTPPPRNAFQRLNDGSRLWEAATTKGYHDFLSNVELSLLTRYFQQRHLLAHCEGIVDSKYISNSGDSTYSPGQRIVVKEQSVQQCLDLIDKLASAMAETRRHLY
jgi:uncharacterized Zn finger protein (UPF0148 family)